MLVASPGLNKRNAATLLFCGLVLLFAHSVAAQETAAERGLEIIGRVHHAFSQGDASALLKNCSDQVEIGLFGSPVLFSRPQATYVLQGFFRDFPPREFTVDNSDRAAEDLFLSGRYWFGEEEQPLDVFMRFRRRGTTHEVREVRVERPQP